ncbi:hypothetical protein SDRG_08421 [Saprolegnia diclina VS20]|uniref:Thioredoxin domain-containing protein n=1 Tax=Saprolegnia diclina (strain VS20) TaxID=1156394 RepID=T0Q8J6_SAPDV|nr:hypothetical protein SDRG_08421 [Saprolegnia diclina VS20]EQC34219.1 hypothetical protein SDRG_08421 [Saprolegnia diclina VS20]|eukprot:XP_008612531.1 hypothetical protein SDRG_08421 [Saprolegnia diclina VS20]
MGVTRFLHPYFLVNTALIGSYFGARYMGYESDSIVDVEDYLGMTREQQMFVFLVGFTIINYPNKSTIDAIISMAFLYGKGGVACLFYMLDTTLFVYYLVAWLVAFVLLPYPKYQGPDEIVDLSADSFERRLRADKKTKWIVYFYADWCEDCLHQDAMYAQLSLTHASDELKFGRVDVDKHPSLAREFSIDTNATSTIQLPTMILFEHGKEAKRLPKLDENKKPTKTLLNTYGVELYFDLLAPKDL